MWILIFYYKVNNSFMIGIFGKVIILMINIIVYIFFIIG